MTKTAIIGAGLAGMLAACVFKDAPIFEAGKLVEGHKALLRFRDQSVSTLTGIPFKEVEVRKGIFANGVMWSHCDIQMANLYSKKVAGAYVGRSIWNLDAVKRYVAPEDFYQQLIDRHASRIRAEMSLTTDMMNDLYTSDTRTISTMPLPKILEICEMEGFDAGFEKKAIKVDRYRMPAGSDVYQTVYFPEHDLRVFRASITGDLLIIESVNDETLSFTNRFENPTEELDFILAAMGISEDCFDIQAIESVDQKYGKIIELPRARREALLHKLTNNWGIYSIGRFACWRNILLDDVAKDIRVVERMVDASSYGRDLVLAKR